MMTMWMALALAGAPGLIELEVETKNDTGVVRCALFTATDEWLERASQDATVPIRGRRARCRFAAPPGTYAIVAFHDEDEDAEIDLGPLGIPLEGYGASRNAHRVLGKPAFADAKFEYRGGPVRHRARLSYLSPF